MNFEYYNLTKRECGEVSLPMDNEKFAKMFGEDEVFIETGVGGEHFVTPVRINEVLSKTGDTAFSILIESFLLSEVEEMVENCSLPTIINFNEETKDWLSSSFLSEDDKGRLLYELGFAVLPVKDIPSELIDYIAWDKIYRDMICNSLIREVSIGRDNYILI